MKLAKRLIECLLVAMLLTIIAIPSCQHFKTAMREYKESREFQEYMNARERVEQQLRKQQENEP